MSPPNGFRPPELLVSIVVTTKNEERNIDRCLKSIQFQTWKNIEIIVVDNGSTDQTKKIAFSYTHQVFDHGPERSAQRNFGMIQKAEGKYVMYVDADMILTPGLVERCVKRMQRGDCVALHISEIVLGCSYWSRVRRFERQFYDGTVIDGARFFLKEAFQKAGGFDERFSGPEDWDLDKKIRPLGGIALLKTPRSTGSIGTHGEMDSFLRQRGVDREQFGDLVFHNESDFKVGRYLKKKKYYALGFDAYISKWGKKDPDIQRQFGWGYRYFIVFVEGGKWRRLVRHPLLAGGMLFLRMSVGCVFLARLIQRRRRLEMNGQK
jgi:glycosyltransferase involved in cell wall biosynthesis